MGLNMMSTGAAIVLLGLSMGFPSTDLNDAEAEKSRQPRPLPISMSVAVEAAEAAAPGQAIIAQLDIAAGRPVYEIHMLGVDRSLNTVQVDAQDGQVAVLTEEEPEPTEQEERVRFDHQGGTI